MSRPPAGCISWSSLFFLWEGRWSPFMQDRIKHTPNQSVKLGSWNHFKRGGAHAQRESLFKDVQLKLKAQVTSIIHFFNRLKLREFFFLIPVFTSRVAVTLPTSRLKPTTIYSLAVTNNLIMRFKLCLDVSEGWRWAALAVIPPPDTVKNLPSYTPPLIAVKRWCQLSVRQKDPKAGLLVSSEYREDEQREELSPEPNHSALWISEAAHRRVLLNIWIPPLTCFF